MAFPFGFERGDVDDDAASGVGGFAEADGEDVARDAEVFDGARERKAVRRDDADVALHIHEALRVEVFGVNDGAVDVGEYFEFVRAAHVIAVAGGAVGDEAFAACIAADEGGFEGFNHAVLFGHVLYPAVVFDAHGSCDSVMAR